MPDFRALGHTCGAWLVIAGINLNVVQKAIRHSTITLSIDAFGHLLSGAEAQAVADLAKSFAPIERLGQRGTVNAQCATQGTANRTQQARS
jgi:hypothetical protein